MENLNIPQDIILASNSPRRRSILEQLGFFFSVKTEEVDEAKFFTNISDKESIIDSVGKLAFEKASAVANNNQEFLVIGADTIVVLGSEILGKPNDRDDAFATLTKLSNREHSVMTAVAFICKSNSYIDVQVEESKVTFRKLSDWDIHNYLDNYEFLDKAGAYAIQDGGNLFVKKVNGCYNNIVGFPVNMVIQQFEKYKNSVREI